MTAETASSARPRRGAGPGRRAARAHRERGRARGSHASARRRRSARRSSRRSRSAGADLAALAASQTGDGGRDSRVPARAARGRRAVRPAIRRDRGRRAGGSRLATRRSTLRSPTIPPPKTTTFRARASDLVDLRDRVCRALAGAGQAAPALPDGRHRRRRRSAAVAFSRDRLDALGRRRADGGQRRRAMSRCWRARAACRWSSASATFPRSTARWRLLDAERGRDRDRAHGGAARRLAPPRRGARANGRRRRRAASRRRPSRAPAGAFARSSTFRARRPRGRRRSCGRRRSRAHRIPVRARRRSAGRGDAVRRLSADSRLGGRAAGHDPHARRRRRQADPRRDHRRRSQSVSRRARLAPVAAPAATCSETQLRALARAAAYGNLKVMLPMVTTPDELAEARAHLDAALRRTRVRGRRRPPSRARHDGRGARPRRSRSTASTPTSTRSAATTSCNT